MNLALPFALMGALLVAGCSRAQGKEAPGGPGPSGSAPRPAAPAGPPVAVNVHEVTPSQLRITAPATGTVLARESVELVSELSRRLRRVHMVEGASVKKGALLFELDASDLHAARARLRVQHRLAKLTFERQEKLLAEGVSSQEQYEQARSRKDELEAEMRSISVDVSKTRIVAPFAGTLGLRNVSEGAWVTPATKLATLQDTSTLKLDFTLPERFASAVRAEAEFTFRVAGSGQDHKGRIVAVEPAMQATTRSVLVRGVIDEPAGLAPGAFANVTVPLSTEDALLVPSIALIPAIKGHTVFVEQGGVAKSVLVTLGARSEDRVQVTSGLSPKDRVIVSNLLRIRDGARVKPVPTKP